MIKDIFVPERFRDSYIFPKRIIGFDIGKAHVAATQLYLSGQNMVVEKCFEEKIESSATVSYQERASQTVQKILNAAPNYNAIHTAFNSSAVIFKEVKVPFLEYEKIRAVINYEVEPLLPFSLANAVVDFIIVKQNSEEKSSQVLIAAVQKEQLVQHLAIFESIGIHPDKVTVDLFALFGLYSCVPEYKNMTGDVALVDLGVHVTRVAYLCAGQLRFIRVIPKGLINIAKSVSDARSAQPGDIIDFIIRFGLEHPDDQLYNETMRKALTLFWGELDFTLNSFLTQTGAQSIQSIMLLGRGSDLKGLAAFVSQTLNVPCVLFSLASLFKNSHVSLKDMMYVPHTHMISLSAAFPARAVEQFNLLQQEFARSDMPLFKKQIAVAGALLVCVFALLSVHLYWQVRKLKNEIELSSNEVIGTLKARFPKISEDETDLDEVIESAKGALDEEEKLWFSFSGSASASFMKYLLELTSRIDKKSIDLVVDRVTIDGSQLVLRAKVRDFAALKVLERDLKQSKLFAAVETQEKTDFTQQGMKIRLRQNTEGRR